MRLPGDKSYHALFGTHSILNSPHVVQAKFGLLTGYDFLDIHLLRSNLIDSPLCVLCYSVQGMTAAHLDHCSTINDLHC